jgi:predicted ATPase
MREGHNFGKLGSISLINFRLFDSVGIDFENITILTGPNNSGKSTVIKALLLLDDNIKKRNIGEAGFQGKWDFTSKVHHLSSPILCLKDNDFPICIGLRDSRNAHGYLFCINLEGQQLYDACIVYGSDILFTQVGQNVNINIAFFKAYLFEFIQRQKEILEYRKSEEHEFIDVIKKISKIRSDANSPLSNEELNGLDILYQKVIEKLEILNEEKKETLLAYKFESDVVNLNEFQKVWLVPYGPDITNLSFKYFFNTEPFKEETIFRLFPPLGGFECDEGLNIFYLPAIKGLLERSYPPGEENILKALIEQSLKENISDVNKDAMPPFLNIETQKEFINKWLKEFKIGEKLEFGYDENKGVYFITLDNRSLLDFGYGITQIVSAIILLGLLVQSSKNKEKTVIFEEPESNLHPNFQSLFIEMIVDVQKNYGLNFIIETHSEYMIRKLQYLTAKKEIKPEDSVIYYFNHPNEVAKGAEQVKEINILEDGSLSSNFGTGFFDESTKIIFDTWNQRGKN